MVSNKVVIEWANWHGLNKNYDATVPYVVNGYLFSVGGVGSAVFIKVAVDREIPKEDIKVLKKGLKQFKASNFAMVNTPDDKKYYSLVATMGKVTSENIDGIINLLLSYLTQQNVAPNSSCGFCGNGGCDTYAEDVKYGIFLPSHAECNRVEGERLATEAQKNNTAGGAVRGIVGALVGTVVALVLLILVTYFLNFVHSLELVLIPLFAALFAKWFKGAMKTLTLVFVVIFSLIGAIAFLMLLNYDSSFSDVAFGIYAIITYVFGALSAMGIILTSGEGKQNQAKILLRDAEIAMNARGASVMAGATQAAVEQPIMQSPIEQQPTPPPAQHYADGVSTEPMETPKTPPLDVDAGRETY